MGGYRKGVHQPHRYREREDVRRRPYLEKEISEEYFAPCTVFDRLSLFRRRYAWSLFPFLSFSSLDYRCPSFLLYASQHTAVSAPVEF